MRKRTSSYSVDLQHSTTIPQTENCTFSQRLLSERHNLVHLFAVVNIPQKVGGPQIGNSSLVAWVWTGKQKIQSQHVVSTL